MTLVWHVSICALKSALVPVSFHLSHVMCTIILFFFFFLIWSAWVCVSLWSVEHCCEGKELFTYSFNFQTEVVKNSIDAKFCLRQNNSKLTLYYFGSGKLRYFSQWIMSTRRDINNFSWKELILMLPGTVPSPGSILFPWFLDTTSQCQY